MLRHAISPVRSFTKASNELIRHPRMNSDAKLLLLYIQGLPASACDKPLGEHAKELGLLPREYKRAKKLLVACGFLHEWKAQDDRGYWKTSQLLSNVVLTREEAVALRDGAPAVEPDKEPRGKNPAVGSRKPPTVGHLPPEDEDGEKTSPHPPTEEQPEAPREVAPEVETAERVLLSLRHESRDLLLGVREARGLAEAAAEWLRRGISVAELRHALTAHLPGDGVRSAVGFLRHRLVAKLPERPEAGPARAVGEVVVCEGPGEEHTFRRVGEETCCGPCRREAARQEHDRRHPQYARPAPPEGAPVSWRDHFDKYARGLVT